VRSVVTDTLSDVLRVVRLNGAIYLRIDGSAPWVAETPPVRLETGDVIVFPQGDAHVISSAPGMRGGPGPESYQPGQKGIPVSVSIRGGGDDRATIMCSWGAIRGRSILCSLRCLA
jgi:Cupin